MAIFIATGVSAQNHQWPLSADVNDAVGTAHGTATDVTFISDSERGSVASFNGTSSFISIPSVIYGNQGVTISSWFKNNFNDEWRCAYAFGKDEPNHFRFMTDNGCCGRTEVVLKAGGYEMWPGEIISAQQGDWYHSVITITSHTITGYINGVKSFEGVSENEVLSFEDISNFIGKNFYGDFFNGLISDLRVYNSVLTNAEIATLYVETEMDASITLKAGFSVSDITQTSVKLSATLSEAGKVYATFRVEGDLAPDVATIKTESATLSTTIDISSANVSNNVSFVGGTANIKYVAYFVAESTDVSKQSNIVAIPFKTLADNTVVYSWPLESDAIEANGSGLDGTVEGATFVTDTERGNVTLLTDGYISLPSFMNGLDEMTLSVWFRMDEERIWSRLLSLGEGARVDDDGYRDGLWVIPVSDMDASHPLSLEQTAATGQWSNGLSNPTLNIGQWYHISLVFNGETTKVYLDNNKLSEVGTTKKIGDINDINNYLGKSYWGDPFFGGAMSDLQVHTWALTTAEIEKVMNGETLANEEISNVEVSVKIYPNPAKSFVRISAKEFNSVEIFNSLGQSMLKLDGGKDLEVNTSKFNKGIYIIRLKNNDISVAKRLVIE